MEPPTQLIRLHSWQTWGQWYSVWCGQAKIWEALHSNESPPLLIWCWNSLHYQKLADGTWPHCHWDVRSYLNILTGQWIRQGDSAEYPPHSPDLTPLNFYMWVFLKDMRYHRKPPTLETLLEKTETSLATIPVDTFATVVHELVDRTHKCLQANGGHFEHLF